MPLLTWLTKHVRSPHERQPEPFSPRMVSISPSGRTVCAYRGQLLPGFTHTISIEHLRLVPGIPPADRAPPGTSHILWVLARNLLTERVEVVVSLWVRLQPHSTMASGMDLWLLSDRVVAKIGRYLATKAAISVVEEYKDPRLLRLIGDRRLEAEFAPVRDLFWQDEIDRCYRDMVRHPDLWGLS